MAGKRAKTINGCIDEICHAKVKIHDRGTGKSAVLLNPEKVQVRRIRVDGCLMPTGTIAADFIVSMPKTIDVIVELKGKNVDRAVEQIESTWLFWSRHTEHEPNQLIGAWIVCTEYPRASLKVDRYRENFRARGGVLLISTRIGEERAFTEFIPKYR